MDFFAHQDRARRNTAWLVVYFLLAVAVIIMAVYLAFALLASGITAKVDGVTSQISLWHPQLFFPVSVGTLGLIGVGSAYKTAVLAGGGKTVAEMLGGELLVPSVATGAERKLLNVVEEMAIAAGTPVPPVYLMRNEVGINAFAAGFSPQDAVIGVTRGTVEWLNRDELQGVVAHEFSHIVHGDMRLNLRLMGVLHGILLISLIGYWVMRIAGQSASDDEKGGAAALAFAAFGLALFAIGYIGVFCGHLIKSAVSRQREFLADASAVQFTRNPDGIAGALRKLAALAAGSRIRHPQAEEASHLFFGNGLGPALLNLLATHPPLAQRIRRVDPGWDGALPKLSQDLAEMLEHEAETAPLRQFAAGEAAEAAAGFSAAPPASLPPLPFPSQATVPLRPAPTVARVGTTTDSQRAYANELLEKLPHKLSDMAHEPFDAAALVLAMLLAEDVDAAELQRQQLRAIAPEPLLALMERVRPTVTALPAEQRLPLVEIALPALKRMSPRQIAGFVKAITAMAQADQRISLFEFCLHRLVVHGLGGAGSLFVRATASTMPPRQAITLLMSTLAHAGRQDDSTAAQAFAAGMTQLDAAGASLLPKSQCDLGLLGAALDTLATLRPQWKKRTLAAATACVAADGYGTIEEVELVRVVAHTLDCPLPPLVVGVLRS